MKKYNNRTEVPEKYKWDLTDIFKNLEEFENEYKHCNELIKKYSDYVGCTKDAKKLYDFLEFDVKVTCIWENLYVYAYLVNDQELGVKESIERKNRTLNLNNIICQNGSFFEPELLDLTQEEYDSLFERCNKLLKYKSFLDFVYRKKKHYLKENEQIIVSELINSTNHFSDLSSNLINKEHNYGKIKLDDGTIENIATNNFGKLMKNKNRNIRKKVYKKFNDKLNEYGSTCAGFLNGYVKMKDSLSKIYKYNSSWEQKLYNLNVNDKVFETLVDAVENNTESLQKYYNLRKKILGYDKLHIYDKSVDLINSDKEYSIEEAQKLIRNSLAPLGEDYINKFNKIIDNRYIDYCQYKGKCSGGYSFSTTTNDSRILMSFNGDLDSVSTIAHEAGHNVHHQYLKEYNDEQYRGQENMVCEVVSLTNECLLSKYIADNAKTKEEKLAGIGNMIAIIISNLFGAVREGKIEQQMYEYVHDGGTLTKEYLDQLVLDSYKKYYGNSIEFDINDANGWITRSHYFMNFYLYSYAISISVATNIAKRIIDGDKDMLDKYIEYMKTGCDKWPIETFEKLDINLEEKEVYENAIKYFEDLVKQYEEIYYEKEGE